LGTINAKRAAVRFAAVQQLAVPSNHEGVAHSRDQVVPFPIVAVAAYTGMRRNEILSLRWTDFDEASATLEVERALEHTKAGIEFKPPKTERGRRTVKIDADLASLLNAEREKQQRLITGVPDGAAVELSLVKLPDDVLMFPSPDRLASEKVEIALASPREPLSVTHSFRNRAAKLGFAGLRFHDLRGSHATQLLRRRVPIDVAAART